MTITALDLSIIALLLIRGDSRLLLPSEESCEVDVEDVQTQTGVQLRTNL